MQRLTIMVAIAAFGATACAGPAGSSAAGADGPGGVNAEQDAFLAYAACMRAEGIDMPDPIIEASTGGITVEMGSSISVDPASSDFKQADATCRDEHLDGVVGGPGQELTPEERREQMESALAFAQCMRENGVDMPDPVEENGIMRFEIRDMGEFGTASYREAQEACDHLQAGMGNVTVNARGDGAGQ